MHFAQNLTARQTLSSLPNARRTPSSAQAACSARPQRAHGTKRSLLQICTHRLYVAGAGAVAAAVSSPEEIMSKKSFSTSLRRCSSRSSSSPFFSLAADAHKSARPSMLLSARLAESRSRPILSLDGQRALSSTRIAFHHPCPAQAASAFLQKRAYLASPLLSWQRDAIPWHGSRGSFPASLPARASVR